MKLITWNCQGAFRKKVDFILSHQPDVLVVQECEHPDKLLFKSTTQTPNDILWIGDNKNKGLGVFSYGKHKIKLLDQHNPELKFIAPISIRNGKSEITLLAIWANNKHDPDGQYVEQVWKAVNFYESILKKKHVVLTGDFNSNKIWDRKSRIGSHSDVVEFLENKNIHSVYHKSLKEEQGKEKQSTFFLQRNEDKPYHIDYCFASKAIYYKLDSLEIGKLEST